MRPFWGPDLPLPSTHTGPNAHRAVTQTLSRHRSGVPAQRRRGLGPPRSLGLKGPCTSWEVASRRIGVGGRHYRSYRVLSPGAFSVTPPESTPSLGGSGDWGVRSVSAKGMAGFYHTKNRSIRVLALHYFDPSSRPTNPSRTVEDVDRTDSRVVLDGWEMSVETLGRRRCLRTHVHQGTRRVVPSSNRGFRRVPWGLEVDRGPEGRRGRRRVTDSPPGTRVLVQPVRRDTLHRPCSPVDLLVSVGVQ